MKEYLEQIKKSNFDGIYFLPDEKFERVCIETFKYKEPSEKKPGSVMGDLYDIILFSERCEPEIFQAILSSPVDYISRLIDDGFFGLLACTTVDSEKMMSQLYENLKTAYFYKKEEVDE